MATGQIIEVDPTTLTIALNVRSDARLDKDFVASIKELGVLQPPMVTANEAGGYDVVLGQRRTLAAVDAKLPTIPVYLVDKHEADAARIIDQLTENDQRQQLSEVERMHGYKELALFGISPAQIAKRTATSRKRVDDALAVSESEVASATLESFPITLDQAAAIVEFEDDTAAVERLRGVAESDPGQLPHVIADLREKRERAAESAALEAEFEAAGIAVLKRGSYLYEYIKDYTELDKYGKPGAPLEPAGPDDVADKSILGARALQDWQTGKYVIVPQYYVLTEAEHGLKVLQRPGPEPVKESKEEKAARLAEQAERAQAEQERVARAAARKAAREVRREWIATELLQRAKLPDFTTLLGLQLTFAGIDTYEDNLDERVMAWAGITMPELEDEADEVFPADVVREHLAAQPAAASRWVLACVLDSAEGAMEGYGVIEEAWEKAYLEQLAAWGYGLSEYEQTLTASVSS